MGCAPNHSAQTRGTVLILMVVLLVILGLLATTFVLLTHSDRAGSRALSRADRFEQVRQMSLAYVQALLLEDIVDQNGRFLNGGSAEPYDAPGSDSWLASREYLQFLPGEFWWPYISNLVGGIPGLYERVNLADLENANEPDTDGDGVRDARWIPDDSSLPFANITATDGTKYRVAIRIVDTNGLANINVGMGRKVADAVRMKWDGQYPAYFCLNSNTLLSATVGDDILDYGDGSSIRGRYNVSLSADPETAAHELYDNLYRYLAYPNPGTARPFDMADELALRMLAGPRTDLHSRFTALWPIVKTDIVNNILPCPFTSYSWTAQIRPHFADAVETELRDNLHYPGPAKIPLNNLVASDGTVNENAGKAVYLALLAAMNDNADDSAQFLVNLIDYIDTDNSEVRVIGPAGTPDSIIDFGAWAAAWPSAPTGLNKAFYGIDSQPIISEVYSYREYIEDTATDNDGDGIYTYTYKRDPNACRYAIELYNPTGVAINLNGWRLNAGGNVYNLDGTFEVPAGGYLAIATHNTDHTNRSVDNYKNLAIVIGASQPIMLLRPGPGGTMVTVDKFNGIVPDTPPVPGPPPPQPPSPPIVEDYQRQGNLAEGTSRPVITSFQTIPVNVADMSGSSLGNPPDLAVFNLNANGQGGQIILRNGELHSLGELFYIPKVANDGTNASLIVAMEGQPTGDANYRLKPDAGDSVSVKLLQYLTLRTGLNDGADNDGDSHVDGNGGATAQSILQEARVPGLININTAPAKVLDALHYFSRQVDFGGYTFGQFIDSYNQGGSRFESLCKFAQFCMPPALSKDEDPDGVGVGSPDGILVDNEQKLFHFTNVANLVDVRSDVFVVYITIQASNRDGIFEYQNGQPLHVLRTMAILDRSLCLKPWGTDLSEIPLPRILAQTTLP